MLYFDIITAQDENVWELRGELDLFCVGFGLFLWLLGLISETKPSKVMPEESGEDVLLSEPPFFGCSNASNRYFCLHWSSCIHPFMVDLQFQIQLQCFVSLYFVDAGSSQNVKRGVSGAEGTEKTH